MNDFAATVVAARRRVGLTQAQVAQAAGLTASYLSFIENRKKPPPSDEACTRLATVLGLNPEELIAAAQLERAPEKIRERVARLSSTLSRERNRRFRLLHRLLSPYLFAGPPGYLESAVGRLSLGAQRRKRLRATLRALERKDFDRADDVAAILDTLPDSDRELLLDTLPDLLSARAAHGEAAGKAPPPPSKDQPPTDDALPAAPLDAEPASAVAPQEWITATAPFACEGIEWRAGDQLLVERVATPEGGDVLVAREAGVLQYYALGYSGDTAQPHRLRADVLLRAAAERSLSAADLATWWDACGQGIVVEIRRSLRRRNSSS